MSFSPCHVLIFDFDGTLADTFEVGVKIFNNLSTEFGFRPITEADLPTARKMTARQLIAEYGISQRRVPQIAARGLKLLHARMHEVNPFTGISDVLHELQKRGYILGILTSNSEENVRLFLQRHNLDIFQFVRTSSRLFGKAREVRHLLRKHKWNSTEVAFLGDECRDIEAAQKVGLPMVAVSWGFNSPEALTALTPHALIHQPEDLLAIFPGLSSHEKNLVEGASGA